MTKDTPDTSSDSSTQPADKQERKPPFARVDFLVEEQQLFAELSPNSSDNPTSKHQLQQRLQEGGYDSWLIDDDALKQVAEASSKTNPVKLAVAQCLPASAELVISSDKMSCEISISKAWGGEPISDIAIQELLQQQSIAADLIDRSALNEALTQSRNGQDVELTEIARGTPPQHGEDSSFTLLFDLPKPTSATESDDGTTNYFETHQYPTIHPGTELMRREAPTSGTDGINIEGRVIAAKPGKVIKFGKCEGAEISSEDDNLLLATRKGHPIIARQGVSISDVLELKNVDLSTGNIHFDGSVSILGNVCSQTRVEASGDVNIRGYVENATVVAGNDIVVGAGVISEQAGDDDSPVFTSTLQAGGNIQARFFNQTDARANGNIVAAQYAMNSRLTATQKLLLGDGGGKGVLLGGQAFAGAGAELNTLGSSAYVKTELYCASRKRLVQQQHSLQQDQQRRQRELQQLQAFIDKVGQPEKLGKVLIDKTRKIQNAILGLQERLQNIEAQLHSLEQLIADIPNASVVVHRKLFPNSLVSIGDLPFSSRDELNKTTLKIKGKVIIHE